MSNPPTDLSWHNIYYAVSGSEGRELDSGVYIEQIEPSLQRLDLLQGVRAVRGHSRRLHRDVSLECYALTETLLS